MSIVIEVKEHSKEMINGTAFDRYKFLLKGEQDFYETDGFKRTDNQEINVGDIIENMVIVGHLSSSELCKSHYEAKEYEKNKNERKAAISFQAPTRIERKGIWIPGEFGETITHDDFTGIFSAITDSFTYLNGHTYFIKNGQRQHFFVGQKLDGGTYIELALAPGYEGYINKWFSYDKKARLHSITYIDNQFEYFFISEEYESLKYYSDRLMTIEECSKSKVEVKISKVEFEGQQDLFSLLA